jgi:Protein phosphatase 2C
MAMQHTFFQRAWSCPKQGNTSAENEDAWRTVCTQEADASTLLVVVADGATEGVFSRAWAQTLVNAVTPAWPRLSDAELTAQLQQLRQAYQPLPPGQEMAWNVKTKLMTEGSCATLLAATITASAQGLELQAVAIGDCCLLVLRGDGSLVCSFPMATAADFNTSPALVRSLFQPQLEYRRLSPTRLEVGDVVLVCTDAVGNWALQCVEEQATSVLSGALLDLLAAETMEPSALPVEEIAPATTPPDSVPEDLQRVPATVPADTPAPSLRIIPRWLVPNFVQAWFPPQAPTPVRPTPEPPPVAPPRPTSLPAATLPIAFAQWVARAQAADSQLRMKNDDATLVICVPMFTTEANPLREVQAILRR